MRHFSDEQIEVLEKATEGYWSGGMEPHDAVFKTLSYLYREGWCLVKEEFVSDSVVR